MVTNLGILPEEKLEILKGLSWFS